MALNAITLDPSLTIPDAVPAAATRRRLMFLRNTKAMTGLVILGIFTVLAFIGSWIAPYDPSALSSATMAPPSAQHWLGTTNLGQDILSQILVGTRGVMIVWLASGIIATALAVVIGVPAGFIGGSAPSCCHACLYSSPSAPPCPPSPHCRCACPSPSH